MADRTSADTIAARPTETAETTAHMISVTDHTHLASEIDDSQAERLTRIATHPHLPTRPAAICVQHTAAATLTRATTANSRRAGSAIRTAATCGNYPDGTGTLPDKLRQAEQALQAGVDELDLVADWQHLAHTRDLTHLHREITAHRQLAAGRVALKVILETGEQPDMRLVADAARAAYQAGCDIVKTSTGAAGRTGATIKAATTLLRVAAEHGPQAGVKISGGINTAQQAAAYISLAEGILEEHRPGPSRLRIGSSRLIPNLIASLNQDATPGSPTGTVRASDEHAADGY